VYDGVVLNVCVLANPDVVTVTAQHAVKPYARMRANVNIADYLGTRRDESAIGYLWGHTFVGSDHGFVETGNCHETRY
jgi:hypothetical protein